MDEFQLWLRVSDPNFATPVPSTGRWQFSASESFCALCFRRGRKMRPRLNPVWHSFDSRLLLLTRYFDSLRGLIPASEVFDNSRVCHLVFFCRSVLSSELSNSLVCFLQVGLIVLFQVRWAPGRMFRPANLFDVRPQGKKS